jgi:hypothetical protein
MPPTSPPDLDPGVRRALAAGLFNQVWGLLETPDRTPEQDVAMVHAAHASRHHWDEIGTAENHVRGEWQISRVYSVLGRGEPALVHARLCLQGCQDNGIGDFDLAYAHEAMARALYVLARDDEAAAEAALASECGAAIADAHDREHFQEDIATLG